MRGAPDEVGRGINGDPSEPCPASPPAPAPPDGIAPDWIPTAADVAWAKARYPDLDVLAFTEAVPKINKGGDRAR